MIFKRESTIYINFQFVGALNSYSGEYFSRRLCPLKAFTIFSEHFTQSPSGRERLGWEGHNNISKDNKSNVSHSAISHRHQTITEIHFTLNLNTCIYFSWIIRNQKIICGQSMRITLKICPPSALLTVW